MKIEVGDVVCFVPVGQRLVKKGQVIRIENDEADVWCVSEKAIYRAKIANLKKIT